METKLFAPCSSFVFFLCRCAYPDNMTVLMSDQEMARADNKLNWPSLIDYNWIVFEIVMSTPSPTWSAFYWQKKRDMNITSDSFPCLKPLQSLPTRLRFIHRAITDIAARIHQLSLYNTIEVLCSQSHFIFDTAKWSTNAEMASIQTPSEPNEK